MNNFDTDDCVEGCEEQDKKNRSIQIPLEDHLDEERPGVNLTLQERKSYYYYTD